jgi:hypothetical protein
MSQLSLQLRTGVAVHRMWVMIREHIPLLAYARTCDTLILIFNSNNASVFSSLNPAALTRNRDRQSNRRVTN